jgi:hypothetical protein
MLSTLKKLTHNKASSWSQHQRTPQKWHLKHQQAKGQQKGKEENKCYKCAVEGHFKRECTNWKQEEKVVTLMFFDED